MARKKGKPNKWAQVKISEPFFIGKRGITLTVGDTHSQKHLGYAVITVGGIHWYPYNSKKVKKIIKWDELAEL